MENHIQVVDFYTGFEGEPELQFNFTLIEESKRFIVWVGYFDAIMDAVDPSDEGWSNLAYYYHLNEGWYEDPNWQIPNLVESIHQLQKVRVDDEVAEKVRQNLVRFLLEALTNNVPVVMSYF